MGNKRNNKRELKQLDYRSGKRTLIVISLIHLDRNQGQNYSQWEKENLLALAMERLHQLCAYELEQAKQNGLIKTYPKVSFPPISGFSHPRHVPEGVTWASISVKGKERMIGFMEDHIFYLVFLDRDHEFWKTELKNT